MSAPSWLRFYRQPRSGYGFPWNLADRVVCVYCWTWMRDADGASAGFRRSWRTARRCRRRNP